MYTHDFEIKINGITVAGEIEFNTDGKSKFKTTGGEELTLDQHDRVQKLFEIFESMADCCETDIEKIELVKK